MKNNEHAEMRIGTILILSFIVKILEVIVFQTSKEYYFIVEIHEIFILFADLIFVGY